MKCSACGYERLDFWQTDDKEVGDKDFIRIDCFGKPFETNEETGNYYHGEDRYEKGYLYACPKCMTVKLEIGTL